MKFSDKYSDFYETMSKLMDKVSFDVTVGSTDYDIKYTGSVFFNTSTYFNDEVYFVDEVIFNDGVTVRGDLSVGGDISVTGYTNLNNVNLEGIMRVSSSADIQDTSGNSYLHHMYLHVITLSSTNGATITALPIEGGAGTNQNDVTLVTLKFFIRDRSTPYSSVATLPTTTAANTYFILSPTLSYKINNDIYYVDVSDIETFGTYLSIRGIGYFPTLSGLARIFDINETSFDAFSDYVVMIY